MGTLVRLRFAARLPGCVCPVTARLLSIGQPHHVVLTAAQRHRLEGRMPIATEMKQPEVLRPYLLADELDLPLTVPLGASDPSRSHPALQFDGVVMVVRDAPRHLAVPGVPIP